MVRTAGLRGSEVLSITATHTSLCFQGLAAYSRGGLAQDDYGARHTINGYVDDSPNHTGCF